MKQGSCSVVDCPHDGDSILSLHPGGEDDIENGVLMELVVCGGHQEAIKDGEKYLIDDRPSSRILMGKNLPPVMKSLAVGGVGNVPVYDLRLTDSSGDEWSVKFEVSEKGVELLGNPLGLDSLFKPTPTSID